MNNFSNFRISMRHRGNCLLAIRATYLTITVLFLKFMVLACLICFKVSLAASTPCVIITTTILIIHTYMEKSK